MLDVATTEIAFTGGISGSGRPHRRRAGGHPGVRRLRPGLVFLGHFCVVSEEEFPVPSAETGGLPCAVGVHEGLRVNATQGLRAVPEGALPAPLSLQNPSRLLRAIQ